MNIVEVLVEKFLVQGNELDYPSSALLVVDGVQRVIKVEELSKVVAKKLDRHSKGHVMMSSWGGPGVTRGKSPLFICQLVRQLMTPSITYVIAVVSSAMLGVSLTFQAVSTSVMGSALNLPSAAAFLVFLIGLIPVSIYFLIEWWAHGFFYLPLNEVPWWTYLAGLFGALYIISVTILIPYVGPTIPLATMIFFQLASSLFFDAYGLFGLQKVEVSQTIIAGNVLVLVGCFLIVISNIRERLKDIYDDQNRMIV